VLMVAGKRTNLDSRPAARMGGRKVAQPALPM